MSTQLSTNRVSSPPVALLSGVIRVEITVTATEIIEIHPSLAKEYRSPVVQRVVEESGHIPGTVRAAAAIILEHNYPAGMAEPSQADQRIIQRLKDALALIDVRVIDHIVVGSASTASFAESGLL